MSMRYEYQYAGYNTLPDPPDAGIRHAVHRGPFPAGKAAAQAEADLPDLLRRQLQMAFPQPVHIGHILGMGAVSQVFRPVILRVPIQVHRFRAGR